MSRRRPWLHPALAEAVPEGLPTGALSLLDLGDGERGGHWPTTVALLVEGTVQAGRPVLYVEAGGMQSYADGEWLQQRLRTPLLAVSADEDLVMYGPVTQTPPHGLEDALSWPVTVDGRPYYTCNVPTLHALAGLLRSHEERFGPALVILDDVGWARPYHLFLHDPERVQPPPGGLELSPQALAGWLATDMLDFAEKRPDAPTVVIWQNPAPLEAHALLQNAAVLHLSSRRDHDPDFDLLGCSTRPDLTQSWSAAALVRSRRIITDSGEQ